MKRCLFVLVTMIGLSGLISCGTTSVQSSKSQPKVKVDIIDYQGAAFGSKIPQWAYDISQGQYSETALSNVMPGVSDKKLFVTIARGDNLEFLIEWTDLVDVESRVADEMQRIVGKAVSASLKGSGSAVGDETADTKIKKNVDMYKEAVTAVELNGLEKIASYWTQVKQEKDGKKYYTYCAVWGMDKKLYAKQIHAAMNTVEDNTDEGKALKESLSKRLQRMMAVSNDEEVMDQAESMLDY